MVEPGFVYALLNPSMPDLVKVGRTARDPAGRAGELSRATGVPTSFSLAYRRYFSDGQAAEAFVHAYLEQKGYRVAANREFFRAPLEEVIEAILKASEATEQLLEASSDGEVPLSRDADEFLDCLAVEDRPIWKDVFDAAEAHYYGFGDELQDYGEALKLYKQAAQIGAVDAYLALGKMYRDGEGCVESKSKALEYFKEGARRRDTRCYAEMAELFAAEAQLENAQKCWDRYFAAPRDDSIGWYGYQYLDRCKKEKWPVTYIARLRRHADEIRRAAENLCSLARDQYPTMVRLYEENQREFERLLSDSSQ